MNGWEEGRSLSLGPPELQLLQNYFFLPQQGMALSRLSLTSFPSASWPETLKRLTTGNNSLATLLLHQFLEGCYLQRLHQPLPCRATGLFMVPLSWCRRGQPHPKIGEPRGGNSLQDSYGGEESNSVAPPPPATHKAIGMKPSGYWMLS